MTGRPGGGETPAARSGKGSAAMTGRGSHAGNAGHGGDPGTASRILDAAERLVQVRGFNGFSYADIAAELRITKPALHYHFASKADLGQALITRYAERFAEALGQVEAGSATAAAKLAGYAGLYLSVLRDRKMCLCGMLAAEYQTLPAPMRDAVISFFDSNERWLERVLREGRSDHSLRFAGPARDTARMIVSGLEGAMLVARPYADPARFQAAAERLLAGICAPAGPGGAPPGCGQLTHAGQDQAFGHPPGDPPPGRTGTTDPPGNPGTPRALQHRR